MAHHELQASPETVHWGYFSKSLAPRLYVHSGDLVTLETTPSPTLPAAIRVMVVSTKFRLCNKVRL